MAAVHNNFEKVIAECGFRNSWRRGYQYTLNDGTWTYLLDFEGYAYVLYKEINIYLRPIMGILSIYNKFKRGNQIKLYYEVPIAHFRDPERFRAFVEILTDKLKDDE